MKNKEIKIRKSKSFHIGLLTLSLCLFGLLGLSFLNLWPVPQWGVRVFYADNWALNTEQSIQVIAFNEAEQKLLKSQSQAWLSTTEQGDIPLEVSKESLQNEVFTLRLPRQLKPQLAQLKIHTRSTQGSQRLHLPVRLFRPVVLGVLRDKPHYQPGEDVKVRVLARQAVDQRPLKNESIRMTLHDPKGTQLVQENKITSEWGLVNFDWKLADRVTQGTYTLNIHYGDTSWEENFEVQQAELPPVHFETQYKQGDKPENRHLTVSARDAFGQILRHQPLVLRFPKTKQHFEAFTNTQGKAVFHFDIPLSEDPEKSITALLQLKSGLYPWYNKPLTLPLTLSEPRFYLWKRPGYHRDSSLAGGIVQAIQENGEPLAGVSIFREQEGQYIQVGKTNAAGLWLLATDLSPLDELWVEVQKKKQKIQNKSATFLEPSSHFILALSPFWPEVQTPQISIRGSQTGTFFLHCHQGLESYFSQQITLQAHIPQQVPLPQSIRRGTSVSCALYNHKLQVQTQVSTFIPEEPLTLHWLNKAEAYKPGGTTRLRLQTQWKKSPIASAISLRIYDGRLDALAHSSPFRFGKEFSEPQLKEALEHFPQETHSSLLFLYQTQATQPEIWKMYDGFQKDLSFSHEMNRNLPGYTFHLLLLLLCLGLWWAIFRINLSFFKARREPYLVTDTQFKTQLSMFHKGMWWLCSTPTLGLILFLFLMPGYSTFSDIFTLYFLTPLVFFFLYYRQMRFAHRLWQSHPPHFDVRGWRAAYQIFWIFLLISALLFAYTQGLSWTYHYYLFSEWEVPVILFVFITLGLALLSLFLMEYLASWWSRPTLRLRPRLPFERILILFFVFPFSLMLMLPSFIGAQDRASGYRSNFGVQTRRDGPRQYFPRSLFFAPLLVSNSEGVVDIPLTLSDDLSEWRIEGEAWTAQGHFGKIQDRFITTQALSISAEPVGQIKAQQQIYLPLLLHNRHHTSLQVHLQAKASVFVQPLKALKVHIPAQASQRVFLPLRTLQAGQTDLHVTATAPTAGFQDALKVPLTLAPEGYLQEQVSHGVLEPEQTLPLEIPSVTGHTGTRSIQFSGGITTVLKGLEHIFKMPYGCFEQTSSTTYPNALALRYLNTKLSPEQKSLAYTYLQQGYQRILSFEVDRGGFSLYGQEPASPHLSAYGLLELTDMAKVMEIDTAIRQRLADYLLAQLRWNLDKQETAYVLWAMAEAGQTQSPLFHKALQEQERDLSHEENAYLLALHANTLLVLNQNAAHILDSLKKQIKTSSGGLYWESDTPSIYGSQALSNRLETTALAALAFSRKGTSPDIIADALTFIQNNRDSQGTWHNTQATVLALKFLIHQTPERLQGHVKLKQQTLPPQTILLDRSDPSAALPLRQSKMKLENNSPQRVYYQITTHTYRPQFTPREASNWSLKQSWQKNAWTLAIQNLNIQDTSPLMLTFSLPQGYALEPGWLAHLKNEQQIESFESRGHEVRLYLPVLPARSTFSLSLRWQNTGPVASREMAMTLYDYYTPQQKSIFLVNLHPFHKH